MPPHITPQQGNSGGDIRAYVDLERDLDYEYPDGLDLRPRAENVLHKNLVNKVLTAADDSFSTMQMRHSQWNLIDRTMTAYIPLSTYEQSLRQRREKKGQDFLSENKPVSVVLPNTYAVEDTILTYLTQVFLMPPVFQYEGQGPEDEIGAKLMEVLVANQVHRTKSVLDMHVGFRDCLRYGISGSTMRWVEQWSLRARKRAIPTYSILSGEVSSMEYEREIVEELVFEGNEAQCIDPYRVLPDPNVSIHRIRDGEFFGWVEITDYMSLLSQEKYDPDLFNVKYLYSSEGYQRTSRYTPDLSLREEHANLTSATKTPSSTRKITVVNMFMKVIPKESKLGDSEYPEVWFFRIADEAIVITAMPLGLNHGQYPIAVNATEFDGYSIVPISRLEVIHGLQEITNWMMNSHVANVRKSINNMLVVDPSLVHMPDFKDPGPGLLLRLRRDAWGRGVREAIEQLKVDDITRGNVLDAQFTGSMMQQGSGALDSLQGVMRSGGERRSATEARNTMTSAVSRLEHMAWVISSMYMQDMAYFFAEHTQQLMSEERAMRVLGTWPELLQRTYEVGTQVNVSPLDILVNYDIIIKDGSSATAQGATADVWTQLFQIIGTQPALWQVFDIPRIFMHIARLAGAKNVMDFVQKGGTIQPQVLPDETVAKGAQAGNLVPMGEMPGMM